MPRITDEWHCEDSLPAEEDLKERWQREREVLDDAAGREAELREREREQLQALLSAADLEWSDIEEWSREDAEVAREVVQAARETDGDAPARTADPVARRQPLESTLRPDPGPTEVDLPPLVVDGAIDPEAVAARGETPLAGEMVAMSHTADILDSGKLDYPDRYGYRWRRNGEGEENPDWQYDFGDGWLRARATAYGEGWNDSDFSRVHVYYSYHLTPSDAGYLQLVPPYLTVRGDLYRWAREKWWNDERIDYWVDCSLDIHQDGRGWLDGHTVRVFEGTDRYVYPAGVRRHIYDRLRLPLGTRVTGGDRVTVKAGLTLHARAKSGGSRCVLDFYDGPYEGFEVPYIDWFVR